VLAGARAAYRRLRGVEGLGLGDAKLLAAAGAWLGPAGLPSTMLIACAAALAHAALLARGGSGVGWRTPIPLGPALALGFWITWLHGPVFFALAP
jgi:leader peptidase (prepilin peptidase)/N-methyltransferase